ncbi:MULTISPECIES: hypothetical protein [Pantoea]|jgi:hypothetical protein|uniref:hypothetical protein n=1 Tax=Pantoea TaxID=53335 RepID=UPI000EA06FA7|nr:MULTISPECIES: hypothetical protein [Pantoea]MBZ6387421.1 hypothetical protein [Pantoea piersonii]MBZ6402189.1 hypothetical protein [Pantoea piersonii]MBZ6410471.1 hypothetical protein [Pantoea piersonii]MBZ6429073.1 hypothetical protein [Pantoea piersonii]NYB04502.1 hypothetical protein [Pantoea piersonii]
MQNREVAENVIEALFDVAEKLYASMDMTEACSQEGKISKEEADAYRMTLMSLLEEMDQAIVSPIFVIHPDLRPACCCCGESPENQEAPPQ